MNGVEVFIKTTVTCNEIHGRSVVCSIVDEVGVNVSLDCFVFVSNGYVGMTMTINLPYVCV